MSEIIFSPLESASISFKCDFLNELSACDSSSVIDLFPSSVWMPNLMRFKSLLDGGHGGDALFFVIIDFDKDRQIETSVFTTIHWILKNFLFNHT